MEIKSKLHRRTGQVFDVVYREDNFLNNLEGKSLQAVHAYCFYKDKLVIVYADSIELIDPQDYKKYFEMSKINYAEKSLALHKKLKGKIEVNEYNYLT